MQRVAWLTDIHLNFLGTQQIEAFLDSVLDYKPDALIIGGDTGEARSIVTFLQRIASHIKKPVYFVLGNHDFYFSSISQVRPAVELLSQTSPHLHWLSAAGVIELAPDTALVGHGGWSDGRCGDYEGSTVVLTDYVVIGELGGLNKFERLQKLNALGDEAAAHLRRVLPGALEKYPRVFVATHSPPFKEACWHQGKISDDDFLPHFVCQAMGDALLEIVPQYPDSDVTVLCGHTHGEGRAQVLDNLLVLTGGAEYGAPKVQQVFEVG